jgi:hypothetical protein
MHGLKKVAQKQKVVDRACETPGGKPGAREYPDRLLAKGKSVGTIQQTPPVGQPPGEEKTTCAGCGARLRYHGRRGKTTVFECDNPDCPVGLTEVLNPARGQRGPR